MSAQWRVTAVIDGRHGKYADGGVLATVNLVSAGSALDAVAAIAGSLGDHEETQAQREDPDFAFPQPAIISITVERIDS